MKAILLAFLVLALPLCISAQENEADDIITLDEQTKFRKNEIGLVTQIHFGYENYPGGILIGGNYKRRVNQMLSYRVLGGFTPYQNFKESGITSIKEDTVYRNFYSTDIKAGFLGVGLEVQRKFHKRVYMYAALELLGGYGSGLEYKGTRATKYDDNEPFFIPNTKIPDSEKSKIAFLNFHPAVGSKIVFKRINFGLEVTVLKFSNQMSKLESNNSWAFSGDFNLLSSSTFRTFINYSF